LPSYSNASVLRVEPRPVQVWGRRQRRRRAPMWVQLAMTFQQPPSPRLLPLVSSDPRCQHSEPCPYVSCSRHLALVSKGGGRIELSHRIEVDGRARRLSWRPGDSEAATKRFDAAVLSALEKMPYTCWHAAAAVFGSSEGESPSHERIGQAVGYTSEWVRTALERGIAHMRELTDVEGEGLSRLTWGPACGSVALWQTP
jgi:hypothetical protein